MKFVYRYKPFEIPHLYTVLWNVSIWERYLKILSRKGLFGHKVETHILHFNRTELLSHFKYSLTLRSYYFIIFNLCSDFSQKMQGVTNFLLKIHNYNISNCFFRVCPTKTYPSGNKTKKRERNPSKLRPVAIWGNQGFDEDDRQGNQVVFLDYPEPIVPAGANFDRSIPGNPAEFVGFSKPGARERLQSHRSQVSCSSASFFLMLSSSGGIKARRICSNMRCKRIKFFKSSNLK